MIYLLPIIFKKISWMKQNTYTKWFGVLVILGSVYTGIWTCAEPLGLKTGLTLWLTIAILSILLTTIYLLSYEVVSKTRILIEKDKRIKNIEDELNDLLNIPQSTCCIIQQKDLTCPLGITSLYPEMQSTTRTTLESAKKSFKWYGLSAFNVVHNNQDIFLSKKGVKFHFTILNPDNKDIADLADSYHSDTVGRMSSHKLINESNALLANLKKNVNKNIMVNYCETIPAFRLIIVDDRVIYVSFYEKGKDALNTFQMKIEDNDKNTNVFEWFYQYYEKMQLSIKN